MSNSTEKVLAAALDLPAPARAFLAEKLIESLDVEPAPELSAAWKEAVRRRCREIDEGRIELREAEEVFARADRSLG